MAHARQRARRGDSMTTRRPQTHPDMRRRMPQPNGPYCSLRRSTSFGRSPRLVPRSGRPSRAAEGAKAVGEGQPFHTVLRAGVALFQPKKLVCWGPGDALAVRRFSPIEVWMGPRTSALNSRHCPHERPSFCEVPLVKVRAMCICACPL